MIDKEKIASVVGKHADDYTLGLVVADTPSEQIGSLVRTMRNSLEQGIYLGQVMFIESLWHDASAQPDVKLEGHIICEVSGKAFAAARLTKIANVNAETWKAYVSINKVAYWFYLDDLIPTQEGCSK